MHPQPSRLVRVFSQIVIGICAAMPLSALGQEGQAYQLSGKWYAAKWTPGSWGGKHAHPGVYCVVFPEANTAVELGFGLFSGGAIHLTQVLYPKNLGIAVVTSTIPHGRSSDDEIDRLLFNERKTEATPGISHRVWELQTSFGRTIAGESRNIAPDTKDGPFPLVRSFIVDPKTPFSSLSVHRAFVRGPDRFEVAVLQHAPAPAKEGDVEGTLARITALADSTVRSLQGCTSSIPIRVPR